MWITVSIRFVIKFIVILSVKAVCFCRICRQNLDNLLCLRPVVLFTKYFACSSCRLSSVFKFINLRNMSRLPADQHGFVKARLAMFDKPQPKNNRKLVSNFLGHQRDVKALKNPNLVLNVPKMSQNLQNIRINGDKE